MRRAAGSFALMVMLGISASAQDSKFSKVNVDEAVAFGLKAREVDLYRLQAPARFSWPPVIGGFTTPFLRVALAANAAKRKYKTFGAGDVTPDLLAPEVEIIASAQAAGGTAVANVEAIVVLPKGVKDPSKAIQPIRTRTLDAEFKNLLGFKTDGRGMIAVFPLTILSEDNEVRIVFDKRIPDAHGSADFCDDCSAPIKLKDVR